MLSDDGYEIPWRPPYEAWSVPAWGLAAISILLLGNFFSLPVAPVMVGVSVCMVMVAHRGRQAWRVIKRNSRTGDSALWFMNQKELIKKGEKIPENHYWLGYGFDYGPEEASRVRYLLEKGPERVLGKDAVKPNGAYWIHGAGEEKDIGINLADAVGHTLLTGTTRTGKTRILDLKITQAIMRGEPVIIVDPKGDHELRENAKRACEEAGHPERFFMFHPAYPEDSVRLDPLRNWNRSTELASRIAALIPSETGADPFTAFGWQALNNIVNGLLLVYERPNLVKLRRYIEGGPDDLVSRSLALHFAKHTDNWEDQVRPYVKQARGDTVEGYIRFYHEQVAGAASSPEIEGLISSYKHNREHFQKMIASLIPILGMLTSGPLRELLSPEASLDDPRPAMDISKIIETNSVLYIGLDSLSDTTVGSAIGSIMCADITAVAGNIYNYGTPKPVNLYIDEAAEVVNDPLIQALNKGGGAGFRLTLALQTIADLAARLGSKEKALKVLGNINTLISLRVKDLDTQEYVSETMPEVEIKSLERQYRHGADKDSPLTFTGTYMESLVKEKELLVPPALLGMLPPLHYIANLPGGRVVKGRVPILTRS